mmetsp:Transcript_59186/g.157529  ORF Transcript_59186/g.157529 Transcript_59186/m.157529 type:complete len:231 (-) Transcript_59186:50-742(-)
MPWRRAHCAMPRRPSAHHRDREACLGAREAPSPSMPEASPPPCSGDPTPTPPQGSPPRGCAGSRCLAHAWFWARAAQVRRWREAVVAGAPWEVRASALMALPELPTQDTPEVQHLSRSHWRKLQARDQHQHSQYLRCPMQTCFFQTQTAFASKAQHLHGMISPVLLLLLRVPSCRDCDYEKTPRTPLQPERPRETPPISAKSAAPENASALTSTVAWAAATLIQAILCPW